VATRCLRTSAIGALLLSTALSARAEHVVQVDDVSNGNLRAPTVACEPGGGYVVSWRTGDYFYGTGRRRRLALNGHPIGTEFATTDGAALETPGGAAKVKVASGSDENGQFVVATTLEYYHDGCDSLAGTTTTNCIGYFKRDSRISLQRFAADGTAIGTAIIVEGPGNENYSPDVAVLPASDFVVAWNTCYSYEGDYMARPCGGAQAMLEAFEASGESRFKFRVGDQGIGYTDDRRPKLAAHEDSSFTVVWSGPDYTIDDSNRVLASRYEYDGMPRFQNLDLSGTGSSLAPRPGVAAGNAGDFVAVWNRLTAPKEFHIFARRVGAPLPNDGCPQAPAQSCRAANVSRGRLLLRAGSRPNRSPRLRWKWAGRTTSADSFLDPRRTGTTYRLCLYDASEGSQPLSLTTVAGGTDNGWLRPRKRLYVLDDATGAQDGVHTVRLRAAGATTTRNRLHADGAGTNIPALPLQTPATVQLFASDGDAVDCWQAHYDDPQRNDTDVFRQRGASDSN